MNIHHGNFSLTTSMTSTKGHQASAGHYSNLLSILPLLGFTSQQLSGVPTTPEVTLTLAWSSFSKLDTFVERPTWCGPTTDPRDSLASLA